MLKKKTKIDDLAIFGNQPLFSEELHVGRPNIPDHVKFLNRVEDILSRRWLSNGGPFVDEFENKICEFLGVKHCIAVCNGTIGLEITARALGLTGEVLVPAITFVATPHSLKWQEITPVFCDVDPETFNLDPSEIERHLSSKTTAILAVHLWGRPCNIDAILKVAKKHKLKVIFDASHAFACSYKGQMIGGFGDAEVFSFHATKFINALEGGAIVTNNDGLANKLRWMKNFGYTAFDEVSYLGTNGKMNEVSAAMGLTGLEAMKQFIKVNKKNYETYEESFHNIQGVRLARFSGGERFNYQYIIFQVEKSVKFSRDILYQVLWAENVRVRRYFYPGCHRMEPYNSLNSEAQKNLPVADEALEKLLAFPTGTSLGRREIEQLANLVSFVIENKEEVAERVLALNQAA